MGENEAQSSRLIQAAAKEPKGLWGTLQSFRQQAQAQIMVQYLVLARYRRRTTAITVDEAGTCDFHN
jgi:hypothetical protein